MRVVLSGHDARMTNGERVLELIAEYQAARAAADWPQYQGVPPRSLEDIGRDFEQAMRELSR